MEYMPGGELFHHLKKMKKFGEVQIVFLKIYNFLGNHSLLCCLSFISNRILTQCHEYDL